MDIRRLQHLVTLAEKRNFARAAEALHLSQPALTRSVQAAEAEIGMRLFDRGNGEVVPTPGGEFVLARARRLVFDSRCLKRDVEMYRDRSLGDTACGFGPFPAATFVAELLTEVRESHPGVKLRVVVGNWERLLKHLLDEDIEFFVSDSHDIPERSDLSLRPIERQLGGFFVRPDHPLTRAASVHLDDLAVYGLASVRLPQSVSVQIGQDLRLPLGGRHLLDLECDDVETLKRVTCATDTVLAATFPAVKQDLITGRLVALKVVGAQSLRSEVKLVRLRGRTLSPMAEWLVKRLPGLRADPDPDTGQVGQP